MTVKKTSRRRTTAKPRRITGLEASLLSFRARNGAKPPQFEEIAKYLSAHVRKIVSAKRKGKAENRTFEEIRKVADANKHQIATVSRGVQRSVRRAIVSSNSVAETVALPRR
jgi:hypothetical protein